MELRSLAEAERYLNGLINLERRTRFDYRRLGTARVRALLDAIGRPERDLPCVHVAGSKGKGSVALLTEALLRSAGRRVGTFTSPHLESWCERFRLEGRSVSEEQIVNALRPLIPAVERLRADPDLAPSFFDVSTALALLIFRDSSVECGVIEVGLGGRLDSTNVVESRVSVITSIQLEHTDKLGTTLGEIAAEKAGILRAGAPLLHGPLAPEALAVVLSRAVALDLAVEEVAATEVELIPAGVRLRLPDGRAIAAGVLGRHQATHAALAVRAAERWLGRGLADQEIRVLRTVSLPARVEPIGDAFLDSAHTPESMRALRETLQERRPGRRWVAVVSISSDKDAAGIFRELAPAARAVVLCRAEPLRSREPESLLEEARACGIEGAEVVEQPEAALKRARARLGPEDLLVVTGSVYLAGALRGSLIQAA